MAQLSPFGDKRVSEPRSFVLSNMRTGLFLFASPITISIAFLSLGSEYTLQLYFSHPL